jgi:predicted GNAT family acetyltransferase
VWTDPAARRHGYAVRGMRDLCRLLLGTTPVVTLFVRRDNAAAIALYEALGMRRVLEYRSVLF